MTNSKIKLKKKELVAKDTVAFHWEMPEGFEFKAGQLTHIKLINPSEIDEEGTKRALSFVYNSSENELVTTTRLRDTAFKRELKIFQKAVKLSLMGQMEALPCIKRNQPQLYLLLAVLV